MQRYVVPVTQVDRQFRCGSQKRRRMLTCKEISEYSRQGSDWRVTLLSRGPAAAWDVRWRSNTPRPARPSAFSGEIQERLEETVARACEKGAVVRSAALDVRDRDAMRNFLLDFDAAAPVDCVIASAGMTMVTLAAGAVEDLTQVEGLFDVNLNGVMNTIAPIAPLMRRRRAGQIVLFGSIAAFAPPPQLLRPTPQARRLSSRSRWRPARFIARTASASASSVPALSTRRWPAPSRVGSL